jgi:hypothetical protein
MPACAKLMIRLNWTAPRWEYNKPAYSKIVDEIDGDGTEPGMNFFIFFLMEMHLFRSQSSTI